MRRDGSPGYRRQKGSQGNRAFVEIDGARVYLGRYGSEASWAKYHRLLAEWQANGRRLPVPQNEITVLELIDRFWEFAQEYYRTPDGSPTGSADKFRFALKPLKELYGETPTREFGPRSLKAVRQRLVDKKLARTYVNQCVSHIRQVFKWAVAEELISPDVLHALQAVAGLRRGRGSVHESDPVRPVPERHVEAIRDHVSRQVWAIVQTQLLSGARCGEIVVMRRRDVDTSGRVWLYHPERHKNAHRGHERVIYLGPRAQAVLRPLLETKGPADYVLSPQEAEAERRTRQHAARKTPAHQGNAPGTNRCEDPVRVPGEHYTTTTVRRAIERACKAANVPAWSPHRLRHSAATQIRKEFGIDAARAILGHRSPATTLLYAEMDGMKAIEVISQIG